MRASWSMMFSSSPVGSRGSSDLNNRPAGEAKLSIVSRMAALQAGRGKALRGHRFAQQIPC